MGKQKEIAGERTIPHKTFLAVLILSSLAVIIYFNSLKNDFVFDDLNTIVNYKVIRSLKNIPRMIGFYEGKFHMPRYRPVRVISYAIDYFFSHRNPIGYHISNILYHIITSFLVYLTIFFMIKNYRVALFAAILFAVHPIQTDSVTYLSGRRDILTALFYMLGFYFFLKFRQYNKIKYIVLALFSYGLSIFSKEMAITLPVMFLSYDFIDNFKVKSRRLNLHFFKKILLTLKRVIVKYKYLYVPILAAGIAFGLYTIFVIKPSHRIGWYGDSPLRNFLTVVKILIFYIKQLIYPVRLNADYSYNAFPVSKSFFEPRTLFSVIALVIILYAILKLLKSHKMYAFCGMWFFITLLPVCQIIPHHELLAEHYLYLPSFGFCLLLALLFEKLLSSPKYQYIVYSIFGVLIVLYSYRVIDRNKDWRDNLTLWRETIKTAPNCLRARYDLGKALQQKGMIDQAIVQYQKILEIAPEVMPDIKNDLAWTHNNLGAAYWEKGLIDEAEIEFKKALEIKPNLLWAHNNLGTIYHRKGQLEKASSEYQRAISMAPNFAQAHNNLGNVYRDQGLFDEAIKEYKKALAINPTIQQIYKNLAHIYAKYKNDQSTASYYLKQLQRLSKFKPRQ
jgi:Flp pilus assembly protein TadD